MSFRTLEPGPRQFRFSCPARASRPNDPPTTHHDGGSGLIWGRICQEGAPICPDPVVGSGLFGFVPLIVAVGRRGEAGVGAGRRPPRRGLALTPVSAASG